MIKSFIVFLLSLFCFIELYHLKYHHQQPSHEIKSNAKSF